MKYEEMRDFRDAQKKRWERRHGAIKPTEQYEAPSKTRTESVVGEPKRNREMFLPSEKIKIDEREGIKNGAGSEKTQFPYQKNQNLAGKVRKAGLERCVVDNAKLTSNKSEIGRRCGCDRRTVYRILVEEGKEEEREDNRCPQCNEVLVGYEDEDGVVVCSNCGWEI